jgi:GntR family transcriptional regulator, transcriptional repressor for pyruvate dehydrogenase complex
MVDLNPVSRVTLVEQVALQLAEKISQGFWLRGQKLPSEPELCRALGIGRSTLREALKPLAFMGIVRMRPGEGTYVADVYPGLLSQILARGASSAENRFVDVWETRATLETKLAALAAERADAGDIERLESLLKDMQASLESNGQCTDRDLDFHFAIADASKNCLLRQLLLAIRGMMHEWISKSHELPGKKENAIGEHRRILEAIRQHDPEKAHKAMEAHLVTYRRVLSLVERMSDPATAPESPAVAGL